jgi:hypothetical protein
MVKIIALSGSHGVGKTSLVNKIFNEIQHQDSDNVAVKTFNEINTGLFNLGFCLNGKGIDFDEVMFSQKQAFDLGYNLFNYYLSRKNDNRIVFSDRSPVDTYIYSLYFLKQDQDNFNKYSSTIKEMEEKSFEIATKIETILVPPFEDFDQTAIRMNNKQQLDIWQIFKDYFSNNDNIHYKILKNQTTTSRFNEIMDLYFKNYSQNRSVFYAL